MGKNLPTHLSSLAGRRASRRRVFYDLFWNESLGWFMWESRPERAGDAVYIWSEFKGAIMNR